MDVATAADLTADGLLNWHYDPDPGVLLETVGFDREVSGRDGLTVDRQAMHVGWVSGIPWAYALLAHGIPLVVAGGDLDKPEVAARVAWSGAGVNLRTGRPRSAAIAAAVDRVLGESSFRDAVGVVGKRLRTLGGARRVADLLEDSARAAPVTG